MQSPDVEHPRERAAVRRLLVVTAVVAAVALVVIWFTVIRGSGAKTVAVSLTFHGCSNVGTVTAGGAFWGSTDLAPAAWGDAEDGRLSIDGDNATFRSDSDGHTVAFHRITFSTLDCMIGPRP
jgi:hypothetical protein